MCHKLLQVYACGHLKDVCTTPCPHALATGRQIPQDNSPDLSRSPSVVSTSTLTATPSSPARRNDVQDLPSQRHSQQAQAPAHPSPLRVSVLGEQAPAFRFVPPGDVGRSGEAGATPTCNEQSPTFSTTSTLASPPSPATLFFQAEPEMDTRFVTSFPSPLPLQSLICQKYSRAKLLRLPLPALPAA
jgi:hypothetical protein